MADADPDTDTYPTLHDTARRVKGNAATPAAVRITAAAIVDLLDRGEDSWALDLVTKLAEGHDDGKGGS